jgi:hypothetical protein
MGTMRDPKWWSEEHRSAWERVKAAFRRDWEQTKADVSSKGQDLNQDVGDTIKQAAGKQPIPPEGVQTKPDESDWNSVEDGLRYGYGAKSQYRNDMWDDRLEAKLRNEWDELKTGRSWEDARRAVRDGWDRASPEPTKPPRH